MFTDSDSFKIKLCLCTGEFLYSVTGCFHATTKTDLEVYRWMLTTVSLKTMDGLRDLGNEVTKISSLSSAMYTVKMDSIRRKKINNCFDKMIYKYHNMLTHKSVQRADEGSPRSGFGLQS